MLSFHWSLYLDLWTLKESFERTNEHRNLLYQLQFVRNLLYSISSICSAHTFACEKIHYVTFHATVGANQSETAIHSTQQLIGSRQGNFIILLCFILFYYVFTLDNSHVFMVDNSHVSMVDNSIIQNSRKFNAMIIIFCHQWLHK